jgi:hypothetical protein
MPIKPDPTKIKQAHDCVLRNFFNYQWIAGEVIKVASQTNFAEQANLGSIKLLGDRLDTNNLRYRVTDVLLEVKLMNYVATLLLMIEHSSTVNRDMLMDVWDKLRCLWLNKMKETPDHQGPPYCKVIVISNANRKWTAPTDTDEWLRGVELLTGTERERRVRLAYDVLDLHGRDVSFYENLGVSASTSSFLFSLGFARDADLATKLEKFRYVFDEARREPDGEEIMELLGNYLIVRNPGMTQEIAEYVSDVTDNEFLDELQRSYVGRMYAKWDQERYEQGLEEGLEKGIEKGIEKGRQEGREALWGTLLDVLDSRGINLAPSTVRRITGCTDADLLRQWIRRAATMNPEESLFGPS